MLNKKMPSGLILTHWSLLAIAIISSCFLFYFVASENAKHTVQNKNEADAFILPPINAANNDDAAILHENIDGVQAFSKIKETHHTEKIQKKVMRNYKKVKKSKLLNAIKAPSSILPIARSFFVQNKEQTDVSDTTSFNPLVHEPSSTANKIDVDSDSVNTESVYNDNYNNNDNQRNYVENLNSAGDSDKSLVSKIMKNVMKRKKQNENLAQHIQEEDNTENKNKERLPNIITDIPAVTVTELPLEVLQPMQNSLNTILVDASKKKSEEQDTENRTVDILEHNDKEEPPDDEIVKINDSGGGIDKISNMFTSPITSETLPVQLATEDTTNTLPELQQQQDKQENLTTDGSTASESTTVNLTNEEIPMPVFSEWAQKQMEAAEKQQQAKDQEVVNTIGQKKNLTNGNKKLPTLKMRAKNYASPDCGAKIIASNSDASNTGAVLSSSKDEYMLSPCGNRIWFVVELCEAIQAQKVDLANFELFSSSPKNFTVAVANRFPTRDWSNVGRFVAEDKRNVQSFDLHPHLFGKFVRVDIHSHYSQEHFCPVSLFRVFGTSEIEAFETENHPDDDLDDFDEEFDSGGVAIEQGNNKKNSENIFKSASDAVMSIVKKAAEVLVKPANNQNLTINAQTPLTVLPNLCRTSRNGPFSCNECAPHLVERINNIVSCKFQQVDSLLTIKPLRNDLLNTQICKKHFGVDVKALNNDCMPMTEPITFVDIKRSYFINLLPEEYIGALCHTISSGFNNVSLNNSLNSNFTDQKNNDVALNLTIEKKLKTGDLKILNTDETQKKILIKRKEEKELPTEPELTQSATEMPPIVYVTTDANQLAVEQSDSNFETDNQATTPMPNEEASSLQPDVNIFNLPANEKTLEVELEKPTMENDNIIQTSTETNAEQLTTELPVLTTTTEASPKSEDDAVPNSAWDNLDTLLPTTMSPGQAQQKITGSPQSESVFIRLSNRIKTLERNMSLSGQYLEELSRRYKKQVEELQQILTQQTQNVRNLEEQNRRQNEMQQMYEQNNILLKSELDNMALQLHACIVVIIVVGAFVLLLIVISTLFYRAIWHRSKALQKTLSNGSPCKNGNNKNCNQKKIPRRKSFDDLSDHGTEKMRRPSEEAMDILKNHLDVPEQHKYCSDKMVQTQPQRKISICYGGSKSTEEFAIYKQEIVAKSKNSTKRKGAKNSWSNPNDTPQIDLERLEQLRGMDVTVEEYQQFLQAEKIQKSKAKTPSYIPQTTNVQSKSKKKSQNLRRQESAPAQYGNLLKSIRTNHCDKYGENLLLDEEDLDNFIPNTDLAYNEFMPEGPSGYQTVFDAENGEHMSKSKDCIKEKEKSSKTKKQRRLPSSGFFKTPFSIALKGKSSLTSTQNNTTPSTGGGVNNTPHSSATSWEWHRLRNSSFAVNSSSSNGLHKRHSPTGSLDASTLSEIHFPTNSTNNSFRILEEAILSSGETIDRSPTTIVSNNGNKSHSTASSISGGSGSNSSQRSSISNSHSTTSSTTAKTTKKKQRGFNRIFRKVF